MLERVKELPKDVKAINAEKGRFIIARGEVTGHAHAVEEKGCQMFVGSDGKVYLNVEEETVITHEEHGAIPLPEGVYVYIPQREYTPEAIRNVMD